MEVGKDSGGADGWDVNGVTGKAGDTDDPGGAAGATCGDEPEGIIVCTPILSSTTARCRTQGELLELTSKSASLLRSSAV